MGEAAAGTAQRERGAQHHGIADALCRRLGLVEIIGDLGGDDRLADGLTHLFKQLPVLGALDGLTGGAQQLHATLLENSFFLQLHRQIETRLTADTGDDGVGTLTTQDTGHVFQRQRLHIHLVRDGGVGHDGGGVGVAQHHLVALLTQSQASLGAGIVKLRRLSDDDGAGADDENLLNIGTLCHNAASYGYSGLYTICPSATVSTQRPNKVCPV